MEHHPNDSSDIEEDEMISGDEPDEDQLLLPEKQEDDLPILPIEDESPRSTTSSSAVALGLVIAAAFILGLAIGFFGRPAFIQDLPIQVVVTMVPNEAETVAQANSQMTETESSTSSAANQDAAESNPNPAGPTPTIMDFVLSDARHFQGDDSAPVTIIEFSDFN